MRSGTALPNTYNRLAPSLLPSESLVRLSRLAACALDQGDQSAPLVPRLWIARLAFPLAVPAFVGDTANDESCLLMIPPLPGDIRALAVVPFSSVAGERPVHGGPAELPLAMCAGLAQPRRWLAADRRAIVSIAGTLQTEMRLLERLQRHDQETHERLRNPLRDPATDTATRELFLDRVGQALLRHARTRGRGLAVVSTAIHQLPDIQASVGHEEAQEVMRELARRLRSAVRDVDSVGRISDDELGILLEALRDNSDAARVASRIHDALRQPIATRWDELMVSANIGVVMCERGVDSPSRLVQLATLARERSRIAGTPYEIFDPSMQQTAQRRLHQEMELRRGVERGEFELHYQPIITLATGRIARVEALLRWRQPERGILSASEFIALAEQTGLVIPLGWSVLAKGVAQLAEWRSGGGAMQSLALSMNITAGHLRHRELFERLDTLLSQSQLAPGTVDLEITEGVLIDDPRRARDVLSELRARGVGIHLDDFGTGYSSLQYIHELPLDAIKIDRAFIARICDGEHHRRLVAMIRELARQIGVAVVAEGVETPEQLARVRELGCEYAQGYLFSRPLPPAEMTALLRREPVWVERGDRAEMTGAS